MDFIVNLAAGFMNLFTLGGQQFLSWVTGIIPTIVMLLVLMNAIMAMAGEKTVSRCRAHSQRPARCAGGRGGQQP